MIQWTSGPTTIELPAESPDDVAEWSVVGMNADTIKLLLLTAYDEAGHMLDRRCTPRSLGVAIAKALVGFEVVTGGELVTPKAELPEGAVD